MHTLEETSQTSGAEAPAGEQDPKNDNQETEDKDTKKDTKTTPGEKKKSKKKAMEKDNPTTEEAKAAMEEAKQQRLHTRSQGSRMKQPKITLNMKQASMDEKGKQQKL